MSSAITSVEGLAALLAAQKSAFNVEGAVDAAERRRRIQQVIDLLVAWHKPLAAAMAEDFGNRPAGFSLMNDVLGSLASLKHARDHLEEWMQPQERQPFPPYDQLGAKARVLYQPKGSVAIVGTWNAPLFTLLSPLAYVLAAGNRAILKPSEIAPRTAAVLVAACAEHLDPLLVGVAVGGAEMAEAVTRQAFDHLVFTGSTAIGKVVMRNAADNLVPVTLELGGKSPTIVSRSADLATAAFRIAAAKASNGGQLCVNPDLVFVPREQTEAFLAELKGAYASLFPQVQGNPDVVAVVNERHLARVEGLVEDAIAAGVRVESLPEASAANPDDRRRPLRVVVDPPAGCRIQQEEIFGPAMVLLPYDTIDAVLADINGRDRPLALYWFGSDEAEKQRVLENTLSGGVTINDAMMHAAMQDAPFGGIGASGMGHYHGREGFLEFSHARTVFEAGSYDPRREWGLLPPYGEHFLAAMEAQVTP
ncbi:aldehyde dehydrogenase family protein [Pseudomonas sp. GCM10022188]|uniref:aldehyde dehydrogenase family protein n=1 Tax=Pseudomonas TaxID=286 RepID=UPI001E3EF463|nr:aldehyde dehydrogenase family protein [Pseudomonas oryzagri]MCC6076516.1 aldehyde dehydrogenase family protein [Pseudomonas oryzagri]